MSLENQHIINPTLEEIMAAASPGFPMEERAALKKRLELYTPSDEVLSGAVKFLQDHDYDFDALYNFTEKPINLSVTQKQHSKIINFKKLAVAASILFVSVLAIWFSFFNNQSEKIINKAIINEPGLPVFASVQGNKEFHELMSAFRMKDAAGGLNYYRSLLKKEPLNDTLNYFGGWLYYMNHQPDSAILAFEKVNQVASEIYEQKADYMLAICLYLNNKKTEARQHFENIVKDNSNPYKENALKLLSKKKLWQ